jgi:hypothetical protein
MNVHIVTPFRVIHLQRYGVTEQVCAHLIIGAVTGCSDHVVYYDTGCSLQEKTLTLTLILLTWRIW